jgi:multicomponent Na+:H+ antiporter subunit G
MDILAFVFLIAGLIFFAGGSVGILRFPDIYSRLHPAGKLDTMGLFMAMSGMALYVLGDWSFASILTALKIMLIVVFIFITSPTATHALADAGMRAGLLPRSRKHWEEK